MKKLFSIAVIALSACLFTACGDNAADGPDKTDSTATIIPPPDNSSATNPSMADTAFSKDHSDTSGMRKDSSKMRQ
ncbi:MAG: hypothetical protein ABIQ88_21525 [Chitinophagaceae bacterium]